MDHKVKGLGTRVMPAAASAAFRDRCHAASYAALV